MKELCPGGEIAYKTHVSQPRRIALLLALVTLALYLPVAWFDFVDYDDGLYVTENPMVQAGVSWAGIKWAFTTMAACNWHPVTMLSHMVDCGLFGLNPAGPHLVNALLHAVNAALLLLLLFRLTGRCWPAAFIAALFAWHPMHVESVAWISERKDVLSTFFGLLALLAYTDYVRQNQRRGYWLAIVCFAVGIMAKPMLVTLPCVLLLLDFWPLERARLTIVAWREWVKLVIEKVPFLVITAAMSLMTFLAQSQQSSNAVSSLETVTISYRLRNLPLAYVEYLRKLLWPVDLAVFYPLPEKIHWAWSLVCATLLALITMVAIGQRRSRPYLLSGWFWFVGMLVPVSGLVLVGSAQIADRYTYLSAVGVFIIVTFAAMEVGARWRLSGKILGAAAGVVLLACAGATEKQLWFWRNSETLFRRALSVTTDNDVSRNNLGVALEQQGRLAEADEQYRAAARLAPKKYQAQHNLALLLDRQGRHEEAMQQHRLAVKIAPQVPYLQFTLGQALVLTGQTNEALQAFAEAARLDEKYPLPHVELARIYLARGEDAGAIAELRQAVRLAPDNVDILTFAAQVLAAAENPAIRDGKMAVALANKANVLAGGRRPFTLDVLGMAYAEAGRFEDAQRATQDALELATAMKLTGTEPIQQRLKLYQQHQPWRESFRAPAAPAKL